jgi:hypothetical protein
MNQCSFIKSLATHLVASLLLLSSSTLADFTPFPDTCQSSFHCESIIESMTSKPSHHFSILCSCIDKYVRHRNKPSLNHDISQLPESMTAINPRPVQPPHRPLTYISSQHDIDSYNTYYRLHQPTVQHIAQDGNLDTTQPRLHPPSTPYPTQDALAFPISDSPPRATLYFHDLTGRARLEDVPYEAQISPLLVFTAWELLSWTLVLSRGVLCRSGLVDQNGGDFLLLGRRRVLKNIGLRKSSWSAQNISQGHRYETRVVYQATL